MSLKDLMVHLDQDGRTTARLEMAVAIAKAHQARLVGVFGQRAKAQQVGVVASWPPEDYALAAANGKAAFDKATSGLPHTEWLDINRGSDAALLALITAAARHSDIGILGQHQDNGLLPQDLVEEVIANSGRPILVVPSVGDYHPAFKRPLIAWNDSRESAQALNAALPLMKGCDEAVILSLAPRPDHAESCCQAVSSHLACHGIKTCTESLVVDDIGIMDMLLNRVADHGADLLVMGAHGHIGFPFISRGAGTRHVLRTMTVPVLMAG